MLTFALLIAAAPGDALLAPHFSELLRRVDRPIATYALVDPPTQMYAAGDPLVLFMNRHGGSYTCNDDDAARNFSSIACGTNSGIADVGPFSGSDEQWAEVMSCLTDLFAPFRLAVTDQEPTDGTTYIETVIGGSPNEAGMGFGVGGVAPYACDVIPGAVVYTFSDIYGNDMRSICETAAQEVAHAFGLDHELLCEDPMTYLTDCGEKSFQDEWVPCGEFETRECTCNGPTQNSVQYMLEMFGPADGSTWTPPVDSQLPTVEMLGPDDGAIMTAVDKLLVVARATDDVGFTVVELEWDISGERLFCPATVGSYTCVREDNDYRWLISVGTGARTFRVHVRDAGGNDVYGPDVSVWLSSDGSGPPADVGPPTIVLGSPLPGAVLPAGERFQIVASIVDDNALISAELNWRRRGQDRWIPCPYEDERVSCEVSGSAYRWTVSTFREGEREFQLRAVDVLSKRTITPLYTIETIEGADFPASDGNDAIDQAATVGCDETVELDGGDADWFVVDAEPGYAVNVSVNSDAQLFATSSGALVAQGSGSVDVVSEGAIELAVQPVSADSGALSVTVTCVAPPVPAAEGCACGSATLTPLAFALLAAARLRRRGPAGRRRPDYMRKR